MQMGNNIDGFWKLSSANRGSDVDPAALGGAVETQDGNLVPRHARKGKIVQQPPETLAPIENHPW